MSDVKKDYAEKLMGCMELLDEELSSIKSGRATTKIFDDLEVKAYGDMALFCDVAQTVVQGSSNLLVKIFDETVKDEVIKALNRSDFDL